MKKGDDDLKVIYAQNNENINHKNIDEYSSQELFLYAIIKEFYSQVSDIFNEKEIVVDIMLGSISENEKFIDINFFIDVEQEIKILEEILDNAYQKCHIISIVKRGKIIEYGLKFNKNEI